VRGNPCDCVIADLGDRLPRSHPIDALGRGSKSAEKLPPCEGDEGGPRSAWGPSLGPRTARLDETAVRLDVLEQFGGPEHRSFVRPARTARLDESAVRLNALE
jgi:hypothetical protein